MNSPSRGRSGLPLAHLEQRRDEPSLDRLLHLRAHRFLVSKLHVPMCTALHVLKQLEVPCVHPSCPIAAGAKWD